MTNACWKCSNRRFLLDLQAFSCFDALRQQVPLARKVPITGFLGSDKRLECRYWNQLPPPFGTAENAKHAPEENHKRFHSINRETV